MPPRSSRALLLLIASLAALAALRLGYESWRLLFDAGENGAIDLQLLRDFTVEWFEGQPIYELSRQAAHPPATYAMMWPLVGWLPWTAVRWLWAAFSALTLAGLIAPALREAGLRTARERWTGALLVLALAPTAVTIGNGQITFLPLAAILAAVLVLRDGPAGWGRDLVAAAALVVALAKPNVSLPFFWVVLFALRGYRAVALAAVGYAGVTLLAVAFQEGGLLEVARDWLGRAAGVSRYGGYLNIHAWLAAVGWEEASLPATALVFVATGVWVWRHRRDDLWALLGVVAVVARLWTYHRVYDDLLMVFPLIALARIARREEWRGPAVWVLAAAAVVVLAPVTLLRWSAAPGQAWSWTVAAIWVGTLGFLARRAREGAPARPAAGG